MVGIDGAGLVQRCGGECVVGDAVDLARQSTGALEQRLDGGGFEQGQFAAGEPQAVGEVVVDLVALEPGEMVADDEALGERFVHGPW